MSPDGHQLTDSQPFQPLLDYTACVMQANIINPAMVHVHPGLASRVLRWLYIFAALSESH